MLMPSPRLRVRIDCAIAVAGKLKGWGGAVRRQKAALTREWTPGA